MNFKQLIRLMHVNLQTPKNVAPPLMIWSDPGTAKTSAAYALAQSYKWRKNVLITSMMDPTDIGGTPYPSEKNEYTKHLKPQWFHDAMKGEPTLIIWDEITSSPAACQAATMRIVHEGAIDDDYLPDTARHMLIGNPPETAANGTEMPYPLANRLQHVQTDGPDLTEFLAHLAGEDNVPALEKVDPEKRQIAYDHVQSVVEGYARKLGALPKESPAAIRGRFPMAYATIRSWRNLVNLYATAIALDMEDLLPTIAIGTIGEPCGIQFEKARKEMNLPNADDLLDGKVKWNPKADRPDITFAVCGAIGRAAVRADNKKTAEYKRRWSAAWPLLDKVLPMGEDFVAIATRILVNEKNRPSNWADNPLVVKIAAIVNPVINASGIARDKK
jgi:hypothetical protein